MYLAPFNYDRFFQRLFKDPAIAKRFFEDYLNRKIKTFEPLPRKNKITDDAAFVEFDYHCIIDGEYFILDIQQWYKQDVVKRFYMYECNNISLQLEKMKNVIVPISEVVEYKTKNYDQLKPATTLVWMVDDTLEFTESIVTYSMFPKNASNFIQNEELWARLNKEELLVHRQKVLEIMNNKHKNLDFLHENDLTFMLQKNIIKNKPPIKILKWVQFAAKTKNKNNVAADFKQFSNDPIFVKMIELLRTSVLSDDDFQYIEDYEAHRIGVENYNEKVERMAQKRIVRHMRLKGFSAELVADMSGIPLSDVNVFFRELANE